MPKTAIGLIVLVPLAVLGLYGALGQPNLPDAPFAGRTSELPLLADDGRLDLNKLRDALKQRLAATPDSLEGWLYLARTDGSLEDWVGARDAWRHARDLGHDRPDILEGYGETLVGEAHGRITDEAQAVFRQLLAADAKSPAARYYLALAKAQHGDMAGAARDWRRLLADSPPESPWRGQVQQMIAQAGSAVSSPPADQQAAIMALPPEQRAQAIQGMVAGLAARLQAHPDDAEGWGRLARAYTVLGDKAKAADAAAHLAALNQAREAHP
jgi:cytochrome c-type biogenesis protein CcmH